MERDSAVDALKAFAIFLVVLGHIQPVQAAENFIYSFHMPLFMFLSGITFCHSFARRKSAAAYIGRRCAALLIPYVAWGFVSYFLRRTELFSVSGFVLNPFSAAHFNYLWFLPTLFCIVCVCAASQCAGSRALKRRFVAELLVLLCGAFLLAVLYRFSGIKLFRQSLIYFPPFVLGLFMTEYSGFRGIMQSRGILTVLIVLYCALFPFYSTENQNLLSYIARFGCGISLTVPLYFVAQNWIPFPQYKSLRGGVLLLSKNTLSVYVIHEFFRPLFALPIQNAFYDTGLKVLSALVLCGLCVVVGEFVGNTSPALALILFGKIDKSGLGIVKFARDKKLRKERKICTSYS